MNTLNEKPPTVHAGLDIAKATLHLHLQHVHHVLDNHPKGHAALLEKVRAVPGVQVVCEATGGYEKGVVAALHAATQPVSVVNPALVRHFALAQGQRAKNDPIDAAVLTAYGEALRPAPAKEAGGPVGKANGRRGKGMSKSAGACAADSGASRATRTTRRGGPDHGVERVEPPARTGHAQPAGGRRAGGVGPLGEAKRAVGRTSGTSEAGVVRCGGRST